MEMEKGKKTQRGSLLGGNVISGGGGIWRWDERLEINVDGIYILHYRRLGSMDIAIGYNDNCLHTVRFQVRFLHTFLL